MKLTALKNLGNQNVEVFESILSKTFEGNRLSAFEQLMIKGGDGDDDEDEDNQIIYL